eukprot:TRINITY_DN202_c0_g3_i4.p1 TRINITY_DN202_c0_g3~~TRINITY_DN202_c0_g3_i4.p1  ORF type:complete len:1558 (-),score=275.10 TRINITY_DN202_c0_g3_i4:700-5373(-)
MNGLRSPNTFPPVPYFETPGLIRLEAAGQSRFSLKMLKVEGDIPSNRYGSCIVSDDSKVWLFGGYSPSPDPAHVFRFDINEQTWKRVSGAPFTNTEGQTCLMEGSMIYIIGGYETSRKAFGQAYIFDTGFRRWIERSGFAAGPMVSYAAGAAYGGSLYIFGGWDGTKESGELWKYSGAWSLEKIVDTKPATTVVPSTLSIIPRQQACSWTFANELHLFGGLRHGIGLGDLLVFDLDKKEVVFHQEEYTESEWPPIRPQARYGASCVLLGDVGYMMGGATDPRETAHDSWLYLPEMRSWIDNSLSNMPLSRRDHGLTKGPNNTLLMFGGTYKQSHTFYLNDLWAYTIEDNRWEMLSGLYRKDTTPLGRVFMGLGFLNDLVYVFGGKTERADSDPNLWTFSLGSRVWRSTSVLVSASSTLSFHLGSAPAGLENGWILLGTQRMNSAASSRMALFHMSLLEPSMKEILAANTGPPPRSRSSIGFWNNQVTVCGGVGPQEVIMDDVWTFSFETMLWSKRDVSIGSRRLLPSFSFYGQYLMIIGEEIGSTHSIQLLDTNTGNILKEIHTSMVISPELSGQACVWMEDGAWLFGGQESSIYVTDIHHFTPETCKANTSEQVGKMTATLLEDGSHAWPYRVSKHCSWVVLHSNVLEIEYDLADGDSVSVLPILDSESKSGAFEIRGDGNLTSYLSTQGFRIRLDSKYNASTTATGFRIWHAHCPAFSHYISQLGCVCETGYSADQRNMACHRCDKDDCKDKDIVSDLQVLKYVLPSVFFGLMLAALWIVTHYRRRIRVYQIKYERRMMLADCNDFVIDGNIDTPRKPPVFRGRFRGSGAEIDVISPISCSAEQLELRLNSIASYRHSNIHLYMGACITENGLWMAFERMDCGSLLDYLKANPHLSWKTKVDILLQVANGLVFLHSSSPPMIHRNLSSANVLIDHQGHVKISGLARVVFGSDQDVNHQLGKAPWCAPEILLGEAVTTKTDCYSFGIIAWEVSSQMQLYEDFTNLLQLIDQVIQKHLRPTIPEGCLYDLRIIMEKCWSRQPDTRPDALEIMNCLKVIRVEETPANSFKESHRSLSEGNRAGLFVIALKIWKEHELWREIPEEMPEICSKLYDTSTEVLQDFGLTLNLESDVVVWSASNNLADCVQASFRMTSALESTDWPESLREFYMKLGEDVGAIQGLKIQMVLSGAKFIDVGHFLKDMALQSLLKSCKESFRYCQGGQFIMPDHLQNEISPEILNCCTRRPTASDGGTPAFIEILHEDQKMRANYFENQNAGIPNCIPQGPIAQIHDSLQTIQLDWNQLNRLGPTINNCSLSRVWMRETQDSKILVRDLTVTLKSFKDYFRLKQEIYMCRKWLHPSISKLVGYCQHQSTVLIAISGDSFVGLDVYLKTLPPPGLNEFRLQVCFQVTDALKYLHGQQRPQAFRALDWRNIRVINERQVQLGFMGTSLEFDGNGDSRFIRHACCAPEVLVQRKGGTEADVYSYGVLLWEISQNEEAFFGLTRTELETIVLHGSGLDLSRIHNATLKSVIASVCAYDPDQRPGIHEIEPNADWWMS